MDTFVDETFNERKSELHILAPKKAYNMCMYIITLVQYQ